MTVDEDEESIARRGDTAGRLTESRVRQIIYDEAPAPAGVDSETIAAARRIARHFDEHGCG